MHTKMEMLATRDENPKDMKLNWPRAKTPTYWMVMGLNPNLDNEDRKMNWNLPRLPDAR
jgi:hypothetical protein